MFVLFLMLSRYLEQTLPISSILVISIITENSGWAKGKIWLVMPDDPLLF